MTNAIQPFHLIIIALAGWLNRHQQVVIDYLMEENRVLKEQLEGKRLRFTDEQRIRLAVKAKVLGRRSLDELEALVTPDTLLAWHRKLTAKKWTYGRKGPGRPRVAQGITDSVLRMARENASWGYDRIQGALANLGHIIAPNTVKNILKRHGIEPAPERGKRTSWKTFLKAHWDVMAATDFFTVEVWTSRGLMTYYVLFCATRGRTRIYQGSLRSGVLPPVPYRAVHWGQPQGAKRSGQCSLPSSRRATEPRGDVATASLGAVGS